jgi:hypothetical protein
MQDDGIDDATSLGVNRIALSSWWSSTHAATQSKEGNREWFWPMLPIEISTRSMLDGAP